MVASFLILASVLWLAYAGKQCWELRAKMWTSLKKKIDADTDVGLMKVVEETL